LRKVIDEHDSLISKQKDQIELLMNALTESQNQWEGYKNEVEYHEAGKKNVLFEKNS
jgi:hypothetical protein